MTLLNWVVFAITLLVLVYFSTYLPSHRDATEKLVKNFRTELSPGAKVLLRIPGIAYPIVAVLLAIVVLLVQRFSKSRTVATCVRALISVISCIVIMLVHDMMTQPILDLMRAVSGP